MDSSAASGASPFWKTRRYALPGLLVEIRCEGADLCEAVELVLAYFGFTPVSFLSAKARGSFSRERRVDIRLAFRTVRETHRIPKDSEHVSTHNGVELWRSGYALHLVNDRSITEANFARGTAFGVIAGSPWAVHNVVESSGATERRPLALGFVNLVLQTLLVLLMRRSLFPLHAAALATADGIEAALPAGVLLAAQSDSGKSTLAMGLVRAGWDYLSDDSLLIHPIISADGDEILIEALPLRRDFGLDVDAAEDFPEIVRHWQPFLTEERKRRVDITSLYPGRALARCAPRLLLFPSITHIQRSRFEPMGATEALLALVSHSPLLGSTREAAPAHLDALRRLALQAPAFRLCAGYDLKHSPDLLAEMVAPLLSQYTADRG